MIRSLMGLLGWSSERGVPPRRSALGLESLDGRVMPAAMIIDPPRDGEEIPTVTRHSTEEIPQSDRGEVSVCRSRGSTEEIPQWPTSHPGEVTLYLSNGSLQEIPSFM